MAEVQMAESTREEESCKELKLVSELDGHSDRAWSLAWNPTMPILASCSSDRDVRLFNYNIPKKSANDTSQIEQEEPKFFLKEVIPTGHRRTVRSIAWSPSGKTLATASFDSTVGIWERVADVMMAVKSSGGNGNGNDDEDDDQENGFGAGGEGAEWDCIGTLEGHDSECKAVAFSHTGAVLASCSRDKSVWVWEVQAEAEFDCLSVLMEHSQDVKTVAWHPKEEILASASYDDTIKLYVDDPSEEWFNYTTLTGHTSTIWSLSFSPCGNYLASASEDVTVRIWRRLTPEQAERKGLKVLGKIDGIRKGDRWICVRVLKGWHTRSIYSVSWGAGGGGEGGEDDDDDDVEIRDNPSFSSSSSPSSTSLGKIATAGADGSICIFQVSSNQTRKRPTAITQTDEDTTMPPPPEEEEENLAPNVELIARQYQAHGDADINCVSWAPTKLNKSPDQALQESAMRFREIDDDEAEELQRKQQQGSGRAEKRNLFPLGNLLASAADDGSVKVWIL